MREELQKSIAIVPVLKYGEEAIYKIKDPEILNFYGEIVMIPALEGMIEKKLTQKGVLDLYAKYESLRKNNQNPVIAIPSDVEYKKEHYFFLKENTNSVFLNDEIGLELNNKKILVIDLHNYYHRMFYAGPEIISSSGEAITLKKYLEKLLKWLTKYYDYVVFTSEGTNLIRKNEKITKFLEKYGYQNGYKGKRPEKDPSLISQIQQCNAFLRENGYKVLEKEGYEADDIIASVVKKILNYATNTQIHILSSDKDLYQLLSVNNDPYTIKNKNEVKIFHPKEKRLIGISECVEKFGVFPERLLDFFALKGDSADNVPGAKGIGEKTAIKLINEYHTLENIFSKITEIDEKIKEKILASKPLIMVSRDLIYLRENLFELETIEDLINPIKKEEQ